MELDLAITVGIHDTMDVEGLFEGTIGFRYLKCLSLLLLLVIYYTLVILACLYMFGAKSIHILIFTHHSESSLRKFRNDLYGFLQVLQVL